MKRRLQMLFTFNEVVDVLGGPVRLGKLTGQSCAAVCNWRRHRGVFPSKYFPCMRDALAAEGYCAPEYLWGFYGTEPTSKEEQAA